MARARLTETQKKRIVECGYLCERCMASIDRANQGKGPKANVAALTEAASEWSAEAFAIATQAVHA